jgi:hypothetical protein
MYLPDSNILLTRFLTPDGVGEVVDFMPVAGARRKRAEDHQVVRLIRGVARRHARSAWSAAPRSTTAVTRVAPERGPVGWRFPSPGYSARHS